MTGLPRQDTDTWPMIRSLVGVGLLCGLIIVSVYEVTAPVIARNRAEALGAAIDEALPGAADRAAFRWTGDGFEPLEDGRAGERVFAAYDGDGRLIGVAIEAEGMGYQDVIKLLYGYVPERRVVVGMVVLESRETPGLGDRIETDPAFRASFEALDTRGPITAVPRGTRTEPYQIDSITGATISSVAVADIMRASTEVWTGRIAGHLAELSKAP